MALSTPYYLCLHLVVVIIPSNHYYSCSVAALVKGKCKEILFLVNKFNLWSILGLITTSGVRLYEYLISYVGSGLQAVLEIYLIRFLLVCSRKSSSLGTTFFNFYVAIYQLCSISGGLAADKILGEDSRL